MNAILADTANMDTNLATIAGDTTSLDTKTLAHTTLKAGHGLFVDTGASTDLAQDFSSVNEVISFVNSESGSDIFVYEIVVAFYTAGSLTYTDYFTVATLIKMCAKYYVAE
jgi:hypothetical protein